MPRAETGSWKGPGKWKLNELKRCGLRRQDSTHWKISRPEWAVDGEMEKTIESENEEEMAAMDDMLMALFIVGLPFICDVCKAAFVQPPGLRMLARI